MVTEHDILDGAPNTEHLNTEYRLLVKPDPQQGQQLLRVDGFGDVIGCAGFDAGFAVAFHGFGGQGDESAAF